MLLVDMLTEYGGGCAHRVALVAVTTDATLLGLASSHGGDVRGVVLQDVSHDGGMARTRSLDDSGGMCGGGQVVQGGGICSIVRGQVLRC
jgi:hypothetical protein